MQPGGRFMNAPGGVGRFSFAQDFVVLTHHFTTKVLIGEGLLAVFPGLIPAHQQIPLASAGHVCA